MKTGVSTGLWLATCVGAWLRRVAMHHAFRIAVQGAAFQRRTPRVGDSRVRGVDGLLILNCLLLGLGCVSLDSGRLPNPGRVLLTPLDGEVVTAPVKDGARVVVYVFLGIDCPIANRVIPELTALEREFGGRGVVFCPIYPYPDETADRIRKHRDGYGLTGRAYRDPDYRVARVLGAHVTPEVVALTADGSLIYRGRVNDQFTSPGVGRPEATRHDLADALREYLAAGVAFGRAEPAVGCTFRALP